MRKTEKPKISQAEWQVMQVFWDQSPLTANQVTEILTRKTNWGPKTIRTLINRLVQKNALSFKRISREYHYTPLISESECVKEEARSFFAKVRRGALTPLFAEFLEEQQLTETDIEELKQILEQKGSK